jgi:hypothetical protein
MLLSALWTIITWLLGGIIVGALASGAQWGWQAAPAHQTRPRLRTLGLGMLAALAGGALGTWLLGGTYGLPTALWVSGLVVLIVSWLFGRKQAPIG